MVLPKYPIFTLTALLLHLVLAQVPASLSGGFNTQIQVNFKGDSSLGFKDGETIPFPDTANQPVFALGDASGVNTAISYVIMMIGSTDESNFIMHYLQTDFKATGDKTGLSTTSVPIIPYAKPGSFSEAGARKYTFLLYLQKSSEIKSFPQAGGKFDSASFGTANDLEPPIAGISMNVNVDEISGETGASFSSSSASSSSGPSSAPSSAITSSASAASEGATIVTLTTTTTVVSAPEPTPGPSKNITGTDGLTMKTLSGTLVGGGIVSLKPFPAPGDNGVPAVSRILSIMKSSDVSR